MSAARGTATTSTIYDAFRGKTEADQARVIDYIAKGGCLTEFDENKMTLLHHAAFGGNTAILAAVVGVLNGTTAVTAPSGSDGAAEEERQSGPAVPQQKIDLDAGDADDWTPMHYAADQGHTAAVTLLAEEAGANVNARDKSMRTPLHLAALNGKKATVVALLAVGASRNAKNRAGMTPCECAKAAGHEDIVALLSA